MVIALVCLSFCLLLGEKAHADVIYQTEDGLFTLEFDDNCLYLNGLDCLHITVDELMEEYEADDTDTDGEYIKIISNALNYKSLTIHEGNIFIQIFYDPESKINRDIEILLPASGEWYKTMESVLNREIGARNFKDQEAYETERSHVNMKNGNAGSITMNFFSRYYWSNNIVYFSVNAQEGYELESLQTGNSKISIAFGNKGNEYMMADYKIELMRLGKIGEIDLDPDDLTQLIFNQILELEKSRTSTPTPVPTASSKVNKKGLLEGNGVSITATPGPTATATPTPSPEANTEPDPVTVEENVPSIEIIPDAIVMQVNETCKVSYEAHNIDKNQIACVEWRTENESVISLKEDTITAKALGKAKLYCDVSLVNGNVISGICDVTVCPATTSLDVKNDTVRIEEDHIYDALLNVITVPKENSSNRFQWFVSDPEVAEITGNGLIHAKKPGVCMISLKTMDNSFLSTGFRLTVDPDHPLDVNNAFLVSASGLHIDLQNNIPDKYVVDFDASVSLYDLEDKLLTTYPITMKSVLNSKTSYGYGEKIGFTLAYTMKKDNQETKLILAGQGMKAILTITSVTLQDSKKNREKIQDDYSMTYNIE